MMKCAKYYFNDDGIMVPGTLVQRAFSRVFIPYCAHCGWSKQKITKANKHLLVRK